MDDAVKTGQDFIEYLLATSVQLERTLEMRARTPASQALEHPCLEYNGDVLCPFKNMTLWEFLHQLRRYIQESEVSDRSTLSWNELYDLFEGAKVYE